MPDEFYDTCDELGLIASRQMRAREVDTGQLKVTDNSHKHIFQKFT